jgi:hypothetical protein
VAVLVADGAREEDALADEAVNHAANIELLCAIEQGGIHGGVGVRNGGSQKTRRREREGE